MKIKTSELTDAALDWAVAQCEGLEPRIVIVGGAVIVGSDGLQAPLYSSNWAQGGPIIEREMIELVPHCYNLWDAMYRNQHIPSDGPTPLIAAMRCRVASKLGDTVDVPEELA